MPRYDLSRFVEAQQRDYATALAELQHGRKQSHWIWYVFPQVKGLGHSAMSERYGIEGLAEAQAYLAHPLLGPRLVECVEVMLSHAERTAPAILGDIDALKFRSCLTLFSLADPSEPRFAEALRQFFDGEPDPKTLALLKARGQGD